MAKNTSGATPSCCNCKAPLSREAGEMPVIVNENEDPKKCEFWCPQCFVWKRVPLEPGRWSHVVRAGQCIACGCKSFDSGLGRCGACNGKLGPIALPPKDLKVA